VSQPISAFVEGCLASLWPLYYAHAGLAVFPCDASKRPLVPHWREDASTDRAVIEGWWRRWIHADAALALPESMVVVDVDRQAGADGFADFLRLAGVPVDQVEAPQASTPRAGRHVYYASQGRSYVNRRIAGTAIDVRSSGGYVVLPMPAKGREWLRPLLDADMRLRALPPVGAWLDVALRREATRSTAVSVTVPSTDPWVRRRALMLLGRACARIAMAPNGEQHITLNRVSFMVGGVIARGDIGEVEAYDALLAAARAMPAYREPWRDLERQVARSLAAGIARPLELSDCDRVIRQVRGRMQVQRRSSHA
jgi:hypothetical protein